MIVRPLSTVDNTRDYARVSHSRQWSNYNIIINQYTRGRMCLQKNSRSHFLRLVFSGSFCG